MTPFQVLLIEDDDIIAGFIEHTLSKEDIQVTLMPSAESAWSHLKQGHPKVDAILLDRTLPGIDGLEFLYRLKRDPELERIPVIMETGCADQNSIQQSIDAGAYYYLTKPLQRELLVPVVIEAASQYRDYQTLLKTLDQTSQAMLLIEQARFRIRTLQEAHLLTNTLSRLFPDPERASSGLLELLINAVEHGNLEISYQEKTHLLMSRQWHREVERRLKDPRFKERMVCVDFARASDKISLTITDEGNGFDWEPFLEIQPDRVFHLHGRGIAMARRISFDKLEYHGSGNSVEVSVQLG